MFIGLPAYEYYEYYEYCTGGQRPATCGERHLRGYVRLHTSAYPAYRPIARCVYSQKIRPRPEKQSRF